MAITINSCLKPSSPPNPSPNPNSHLSKPTALAPWVGTSWRSQCLTTAACVVFSSAVGLADGVRIASAEAVQLPEVRAVQFWSDKRMCPPWDNNYLERSMPENLPRPFARGKNNRGAVDNQDAPPPAATPPLVRHDSRCFSL